MTLKQGQGHQTEAKSGDPTQSYDRYPASLNLKVSGKGSSLVLLHQESHQLSPLKVKTMQRL